jgi:hypothetical protein
LKLTSHYDVRIDEIMAKLNNQTELYAYLSSMNMTLNDVKALGIEINLSMQTVINDLAAMNVTITDTYSLVSSINVSVVDLTNVVLAMNTSISLDLSEIKLQIADLNQTMNIKLDEILINQTYMQLYLENTMYPVLNATYQNTVIILQQLGIIQTQLNETIQIANATLNIANETKTGVDELVNKSRRIRAWITV